MAAVTAGPSWFKLPTKVLNPASTSASFLSTGVRTPTVRIVADMHDWLRMPSLNLEPFVPTTRPTKTHVLAANAYR